MQKLDVDVEIRSRQNLRIVGFPEKSEEAAPEHFLHTWLKETLGQDTISSLFSIERAYRTPLCPLTAGASPRPIIA